MKGGIRPGVWIAASTALVAAVALLRVVLPGSSGESHRQPTRAASLDRGAAVSAAPIGVHPAAALLPSSPPSAPAVPGSAAGAAPSPPQIQIGLGQRPRSPDSRLASELRVAEEESERRAESLGVVLPPASPVPGQNAASSAAGDETRRILAGDAVLIEYLMQNDYRGTEFPTGYPAEQVTRQAAESMVTGLSPEMRLGLLQVALQTLGPDRIGPRFDPYQIWEGLAVPQ
jgi:hypothetical protein